MLMYQVIFNQGELFLWLFSWMWDLQLWYWQMYAHCVPTRGWPFACYQLNGLILPVISIFFILKFHSISIQNFVYPLSRNILHKVVAT